MSTTQDIVQKLWALCHVLRDDGITYQDYVTELTWLLFLKMAEETGTESQLPKGYRWKDLVSKQGNEQLAFYKSLLQNLGIAGKGMIQQIFHNSSSSLRHPRHLSRLVTEIDSFDWYSARKEGLGDMYEGLLEKNASEQKSGAGQYFTPRPLIESIVEVIKPQPGEVIQDPAAGTGGFLICAHQYVKAETDNFRKLSERQRSFQRRQAITGIELVQSAYRLCLMNALLHGIEGNIILGDCLAPEGAQLPKADVILTNPPFGTKRGGGLPTRTDFPFATSNKQLAFLQHAYRGLKPGGRAAIVLSDNVLFEDGLGTRIRIGLMEECNLHTILRLPPGIFYATGVKTNVLFFQRRKNENHGSTKKVWVYDLRTNMPSFNRSTPLTREHLTSFEKAYGDDPNGGGLRTGGGRLRAFTRQQIAARGDNLDFSPWLKERPRHTANPTPEEISYKIIENLRTASIQIEELLDILAGENITQ